MKTWLGQSKSQCVAHVERSSRTLFKKIVGTFGRLRSHPKVVAIRICDPEVDLPPGTQFEWLDVAAVLDDVIARSFVRLGDIANFEDNFNPYATRAFEVADAKMVVRRKRTSVLYPECDISCGYWGVGLRVMVSWSAESESAFVEAN
jgi:hypothetical protein